MDAKITDTGIRFSFLSKRGIWWTVEGLKSPDGTFFGYMWHRKPLERVTGGWREARSDAYAKVSKEAAKIAKERFDVVLWEG